MVVSRTRKGDIQDRSPKERTKTPKERTKNPQQSEVWSIDYTAPKAAGSGMGLGTSIMHHPVDVTIVYLQKLSPEKLTQGHVIIMTI